MKTTLISILVLIGSAASAGDSGGGSNIHKFDGGIETAALKADGGNEGKSNCFASVSGGSTDGGSSIIFRGGNEGGNEGIFEFARALDKSGYNIEIQEIPGGSDDGRARYQLKVCI